MGTFFGTPATLTVAWSADLGGATLQLPTVPMSIPNTGVTLIHASSLSGTFAGLPNGAIITNLGQKFVIDYDTAAGNVVLLPVVPLHWVGGHGTNWSNPKNWVENQVPNKEAITHLPQQRKPH